MNDDTLRGRRILIVEDDYLIAEEIQCEVRQAGAIVVGPVGSVNSALELIRSDRDLDGVVLDVGLRAEKAFLVADLLLERDVPFVFMTGYDASIIPSRFRHVVYREKPFIAGLAETLERIIRSTAQAPARSSSGAWTRAASASRPFPG